MRRRGLEEPEILAALLTINARRCRPPLPEDEVRQIAASVSRYPPEATESSTGPRIDAADLELPRVAQAAWDALHAANDPPFLFRYGGFPARIERSDDGAPFVQSVTVDRLRGVLARVATWYVDRAAKPGRPARRDPALPPLHVVRDLLARPDPPLPVLTGLVEVPVIAPDGNLQITPGYHAASGLVYVASPSLVLPDVPLAPSKPQLARARALLVDELLGEFPFVGEADQAHAVGAVLLPFVRGLIDGATPFHLIQAPAPGTGKTLLADVVAFPAMGRRLATLAEGRDDDEWRKRVTAKLTAGARVVLLDNIRRRLESGALAAAITAAVWEDRRLGHSDIVRVPVRCLWLGTGNNPALSSEMMRRTVSIRLDARVDRPWLRDGFQRPDLRGWAEAHRGHLVWAALVLIRAWLVADRPAGGRVLGMFESWARTIDGILAVAEIPGFLENLAEFYEQADTEGAEIRVFLGTWWERFEAEEVTVADLLELAATSALEIEAKSDQGRRIRLGKLLAEIRDRHYQVDDLLSVRVMQAGRQRRAILWRLARVSHG